MDDHRRAILGAMNLFESFQLRDLHIRNRIAVSPMCQYSCREGVPNEWHLVHLGSRAVGGAGLVFTEATAVEAIGRISPGDAGIWNHEQAEAWKPITSFIKAQGAVPGIQLAHAGRKASTAAPWLGGKPILEGSDAWTVVAPSAIPFDDKSPMPRALTTHEIHALVHKFEEATVRSLKSGFEVVEIHGAHGYLIHEFLSPLSNQRNDEYGGSFENRIRLLCEITTKVRAVIPLNLPLVVRISATDWAPGGWDLEQSTLLAQRLKTLGVDLIDVSTGALLPNVKIPVAPNFQVPFAEAIRRDAKIATGAVGLITQPHQAQEIISKGQADMVFLARELLRDPYWPRRAAKELGCEISVPLQYARSW